MIFGDSIGGFTILGKGSKLKSWKEVNVNDWIWVPWPSDTWGDIEHRLQQVVQKGQSSVWVINESGASMEIRNPKECLKMVGYVEP